MCRETVWLRSGRRFGELGSMCADRRFGYGIVVDLEEGYLRD